MLRKMMVIYRESSHPPFLNRNYHFSQQIDLLLISIVVLNYGSSHRSNMSNGGLDGRCTTTFAGDYTIHQYTAQNQYLQTLNQWLEAKVAELEQIVKQRTAEVDDLKQDLRQLRDSSDQQIRELHRQAFDHQDKIQRLQEKLSRVMKEFLDNPLVPKVNQLALQKARLEGKLQEYEAKVSYLYRQQRAISYYLPMSYGPCCPLLLDDGAFGSRCVITIILH